MVENVVERRSQLTNPPVANIDQVNLVPCVHSESNQEGDSLESQAVLSCCSRRSNKGAMKQRELHLHKVNALSPAC